MAGNDDDLEPGALIERLNEYLPPVPGIEGPVRPIFIVGLPRSGSTLLVQLLIAHLRLGYATNLVARFWNQPAFGVALNRALSSDPGAVSETDSQYGRTLGYEGHHEFGWFWGRWFDYADSHRIEPQRWNAIETHALRAELSTMEHAWDRPLIFKNPPALSMQIGFFEHFLDEPLYIYLRRSEPEVAVSLWRARLESREGTGAWFSTRPPDVRELERLGPEEQVAGQVRSTRQEIEDQLARVPSRRIRQIDYEALVGAPEEELRNLGEWLRSHRDDLTWRTSRAGVDSLVAPPRSGDGEQLEHFRRLLEGPA
mgnify:CR=1 FL=1